LKHGGFISKNKTHSEGYLNDLRDFWWNPDFIALMAKRWNLHKVNSILDVGCGIGHWSQMLLPYLANDANLVGIDPEAQWIKEAKERSVINELTSKAKYQVGSAEKIPFPDESFDMVTCQTVLIHLSDVEIALKEMQRVLKPGGILAVAEPNNLISCLVFNTLDINDPIENILGLIKIKLTLQRGKSILHEGYDSFGDLVPYSFYKTKLKNIKVYLSDMADYYVPPYKTAREKAIISELEIPSKQSWENEKSISKKYFLAGGGIENEFDKLWQLIVEKFKNKVNGLNDHSYSTSGGELMYLISGIKS